MAPNLPREMLESLAGSSPTEPAKLSNNGATCSKRRGLRPVGRALPGCGCITGWAVPLLLSALPRRMRKALPRPIRRVTSSWSPCFQEGRHSLSRFTKRGTEIGYLRDVGEQTPIRGNSAEHDHASRPEANAGRSQGHGAIPRDQSRWRWTHRSLHFA